MDKFKLQENKYEFPYHYIPQFLKGGVGVRYRFLSWGYEYLCYLFHVVELVDSLSPSSILDVGCGDGRLLGEIADADEKVGVDLSKKAIRFAKAFHPEVDFRAADASELDSTFEVVTAVEVLEHIPDKEISGFIRTLGDRTTEGGKVILTVPTKVKPLQDKHYRHYNIDLFKKELHQSDTQLTITDIEYIYKKPLLLDLYKKLSENRFWLFEMNFLNKLMWNYVWENLRFASDKDGLHLVITLNKGKR